MLYQYKYNLAVIFLLEILFPRKSKYLSGIQILQIWPKQLPHHMVHKLSLHNKIEMQKSNSFLEFLRLVHHVVGYLSGLAVAIYELLACEKFSENLLQSAVYVVGYDSASPPDDVDMLMFLSFSDSHNHAHGIACHASVHEGHRIHHHEHLQVHLHIHHKNNAGNYNE